MSRIQRMTYISGLAVAVLYFLFTLSFSTGWAIGQSLGEFYQAAQIANKHMFSWATYLIVFSALNLIFRSTINRRFFISNYLFSFATAVLMIICGIITLSHLPGLKAMYQELDHDWLNIIATINLSSISTDIFDLGILLAIVLLIQSAGILAMTIYKLRQQLIRASIKKAHTEEESS